MGWTRPIPVKKENIKVENKYYTCSYCGVITVTVIKIFEDTKSVLVKVGSDKCKPFVRSMDYIFDNPEMAKSAGRNWEHDERKRKKKHKKKKVKEDVNN